MEGWRYPPNSIPICYLQVTIYYIHSVHNTNGISIYHHNYSVIKTIYSLILLYSFSNILNLILVSSKYAIVVTGYLEVGCGEWRIQEQVLKSFHWVSIY